MSRHRRPGLAPRLIVVAAVMAMVAVACDSGGGGFSQADIDAAVADKDAAIAALQTQLASASVETDVVQVGQLAPPPGGFQVPGDGWANEESVRGGLWLVAEFDDSDEGPDAWDIAAHPRVYFTSESYDSNFIGALPEEEQPENFIGWHAIDAYSKEVVASALYQYKDPITRGPHGVGVSPDGKWGYVGWSETPEGGSQVSYVGIINIRTMKLDKILMTDAPFEGGRRSQALHHIQAWTMDETGEEFVILQWGFGANGGPHHILNPNDDNRVYRSITYDDVKPMGHPFTTPSPDGKYVYISMGSDWIREGHDTANVAKFDVTTGTSTIITNTGSHPIGITHTQDGLYSYVVDGHSSFLYKIDNTLNEVVASTSTGIAGPYGICLNWDETEAWVNGKGEGTANLGNSMSIFDLVSFRASRERGNTPFYLGGSASSVDHCALHPDPAVNEVWISNMKGWETIVVDLNTYTVEAYIPTPHTGDTHGMAFVWYDGGWDSGVLMGDMGGPKAQAFQDTVKANAAAAAAAAGTEG
jgi:DNA-binding beta-propeller fold protein YncE